jgi:hypothetical protein
MAQTFPQLFALQQVGNAATTLFTVPGLSGAPSTVIRNGVIRFSNTTGAAVTIKAWAVPAAGANADANVFLPTKSINANDFIDVDVPQVGAGAFIQAIAGAATSITAAPMGGFYYS